MVARIGGGPSCPTARGRSLISGRLPSHAAAIEDVSSTLDEAEQRGFAGLCRRLGLATAAAKPWFWG
jgi:hypothetical protein